jgi:cell shape-determining protein MreC
MFPVPPSIDKGSKKGSGFGRIVIANDNLRAQAVVK